MHRTQKWIEMMEEVVAEAQQILSRHDGVHNAHGAYICLKTWLVLCREAEGDDDFNGPDWSNVEVQITHLRILDKTGQMPHGIYNELSEKLIKNKKKHEKTA